MLSSPVKTAANSEQTLTGVYPNHTAAKITEKLKDTSRSASPSKWSPMNPLPETQHRDKTLKTLDRQLYWAAYHGDAAKVHVQTKDNWPIRNVSQVQEQLKNGAEVEYIDPKDTVAR